jgi:hypothetical protein
MNNTTKIIIFFLLLIIIYFLLIAIFSEDVIDKTNNNYNITKDGVCVLKGILNENEINNLKEKCKEKNYEFVKKYLINNIKINETIKKEVGEGYLLQDYIWIIQKSSVHTCHRDNNGDFFNEGQKHPSYTMLIYLEDMEKCLGVVPRSHEDPNSYNINMTNPIINLLCNKGDIIIFNANLIHVGTLNKKDDNLRIQMKVTHKDDIPILSYYQNFNKVLNEDNKIPKPLLYFQKNMSCLFPIVSDYTQSENIRTARGSSDGVNIGSFQKMFSYIFYGNSDFYDLPNAF